MGDATATYLDKQHITSTPTVCGGKPCIAGTRIRVWDIAQLTELGLSADDIVTRHSQLSLAQVYAALAYYHDHREEIEAQAAADTKRVEELRTKQGLGVLDKWRAEMAADAEVSPR